MTELQEQLRNLHSINVQLRWLQEAVEGGIATREQHNERIRLTKEAEDITSKIPVMFGSQTYKMEPK